MGFVIGTYALVTLRLTSLASTPDREISVGCSQLKEKIGHLHSIDSGA